MAPLNDLCRRSVSTCQIAQSVVFALAYGLLDVLISLPFSYYATFVLEERVRGL